MKKMTVTGKTIDEAIRAGLNQLNISMDRVNVQVIEEPVRGFFGFRSKEAKVELTVIPDALEEAEDFLRRMTTLMGLQVRLHVSKEKDHDLIEITGDELGIIIGRRGQTLDALQYLVNIVANRYTGTGKHLRIVLDAEDFRKKRKETLEQLAFRLAERVKRTGKEVVLEPMSAHDRKVIHATLQGHRDVATYSKGNEPSRRVVINMKA